MAYLIRTDVVPSKIPLVFLVEALDDDGDQKEDAGLFDQIVATCSNDVDGFLAGEFTTPFPDPAPAAVKSAALAFVMEAIYDRRPTGDVNPWGKRAAWWRDRLEKIGKREIPLDSGDDGAPAAPAQFGSNPAVPMRSTGFTY